MSELTTPSGRRLVYDSQGVGPTLLLLAGRGGWRRFWAAQAPAFAPFFRTITLDNRDAGANEPEPDDYTMADLADDAAALLQGLSVTRAHVVGISMGGMIALQLAVRQPQLVDRLVLVATSAGGWPPEALDRLHQPPEPWYDDPVERARLGLAANVAPGFLAAHPEALDLVAAQAVGNRYTRAGAMRQNHAIGTHDVVDQLGAITAPTLVIHGDRDPLVPFQQGELLAGAIPGARLLALPGVGHLPPLERTEEFNRVVLDFLRLAGATNSTGIGEAPEKGVPHDRRTDGRE